MSNKLIDLVHEGGPVMLPLVGMSVATLACALDRGWFWYRANSYGKKVAQDVIEAAQYDLNRASAIAEAAKDSPIGRFLAAPLRLRYPTPETFGLALEAAADKEFTRMRKGGRLLESIVGLAPLLGLLGTVTGLIKTFGNLNVGGGGTAAGATKAAAGIGEALIATAAGMLVAILALVVFRVLVSLQGQQEEYFTEVGSELELVYRQNWYEPTSNGQGPAYPSEPMRDSSLAVDG